MRGGVIAAAAAAASLLASAVWAETPFYVSGSLGGYSRESDVISTSFVHLATPGQAVPGTNSRSFDPGFTANLAVGYKLVPHVRLEAELGYTTYSGGTLRPFTNQPGFPELNGQNFNHVSGNQLSRVTGTLDGFYDFSPIAGLRPYIGAGVGESQNRQSRGVSRAADGATFANASGTATHGLGLLEAGVSIPLARNLYLVPAYRYVHYVAGDQDVAHVVKVGLRYGF